MAKYITLEYNSDFLIKRVMNRFFLVPKNGEKNEQITPVFASYDNNNLKYVSVLKIHNKDILSIGTILENKYIVQKIIKHDNVFEIVF